MSIIDTLIAKIAPHDCLACGAEGHLLCAACADRLPLAAERCYRCCQTSLNSLTCMGCRPTSQLHRLPVATIYDSHAKALIWQLKLAGTRAAVRIMAARMTPLIKGDTRNLFIVPVPTATSRARQRGYDQAKLLARELAWQARLPYHDSLARHGQTHQHGLSRQERLTQLSSAFRVKRPESIKDAHILLVDDVITTGATLEAAANTLRSAGATRIEAIAFARPEVRSIKF